MSFDAARLYRDLVEGSNYIYDAAEAQGDILRAMELHGYGRALEAIADGIRKGDYDDEEN